MKIHIQSNEFNGELEFQTAAELGSLSQYEKWWSHGLRLCGTTLQGSPDFSQFVDGGQTLGEYLEGHLAVPPKTQDSPAFSWPSLRRHRRSGYGPKLGL